MPIPAQGFTITFGGARLQDVQELTITPSQSGDGELGRDGRPAIDGGIVRLSSLEPIEKPRSGKALSRDAIAAQLTIKCMGAVQGGAFRRPGFRFPRGVIIENPDFTVVVNTSTLRVITLLDHICRYEGGSISVSTNDVLRFDHQFTILTEPLSS